MKLDGLLRDYLKMEQKMKVNERGLGDILDEACTLALKVSHNIKDDYSTARFNNILDYLKEIKMNDETRLGFTLLLVNSMCWLAQDNIKRDSENAAMYAVIAQEMNKQRNLLMGELNGGAGIVTEKSY
jgi:hypothetical protein